MARQLDPSIDKVLIKGSAHENSIRTPTGELINDPLHYTLQFKNDTLVQKGTHWKAHAYVELDKQTGKPISWYNTNLKPMREADGKTLVEAPDKYYHPKWQQMWDIWDTSLNKMNVFPEEILEGWFIGDNFVASTVKEKGKVSQTDQDEVKQDLVECKTATELILQQESAEPKQA
ncbi:MAG: hypothetical protein Q9170_003049 [Blastenia crenularia]